VAWECTSCREAGGGVGEPCGEAGGAMDGGMEPWSGATGSSERRGGGAKRESENIS
jgi:hypothetical protein